MFAYNNARSGHAIFPSLEQPPLEYDSVLKMFKQIYEHELMISKSINDLVGVCVDERDFTTQNFLQWYVTEQIEEESLFKDILDKLELLGGDKARLFLFERDIENLIVGKGTSE